MQFLATRNQLLQLGWNDGERDILSEQINLNRQGYQIQLDLIDGLIAGEVENPEETVFHEVQPVLRTIHERLMQQRKEIIAESDKIRKSAQEKYDRGWFWVLITYIGTLVFTGVLMFWIYYRQKAHQTALEYQATHDALTGLANRTQFERQLETALKDTHQNTTHNVVLYLDLDQFKVVNDTSGHIAGDELLKDITRQMRRCIRGSDLIARLGGDEFGVLLWDCNGEKALEIAEKIRETVQAYRFVWSGHEFTIGVSIGVVILSEFFQDVTQVLSAVDVACYTAKDLGRNRVHLYTEDDTESTKRHGELHRVSQVRRAITENHFRLFYQQIHNVGAANDFKKVEILLRMQHEGELVGPDKFIPAAERFNLMSHVDRWVIQHVITILSQTDQGCLQDVQIICINISGSSVADPAFLKFVEELLESADIGDKQICFEITESAAIAKLTRAVHFMSRLKQRGCTFALDDFGKGLSSYTYLQQLPVDYLKIDGSFVRDMQPGSPDYVFVQSMNTVGKALGLKTIAEWVETADTLKQLEELGVDCAQGDYLSSATPCDGAAAELVIPGV